MLARTEPSCLVIADIAGYSSYLAGVELDHAQDILADLSDTVVGALRPSLKLAKLEGDAEFIYVPAETVDGPGLRDVIERCYFAFQRRVRDIRQASMCECNACVRIPGLDLKVVAHHGLIARQRMAGREELVGSDVIVVHRLLKNHVGEDVGLPAYALYTDALAVITIPAPVPRAILWEWATSPARRIRWTSGMTTDVVEDLADGRRGVGTVNHCMHGKDVSIEEVLDWVPPEYETKRIKTSFKGVPRIVITTELIARGPDQPDLVYRVARPRSTKDRLILQAMVGQYRKTVMHDSASLIELAAADAAERAAGRAAEPEVPAGTGRHLWEPMGVAGGPIAYLPDDSGAG